MKKNYDLLWVLMITETWYHNRLETDGSTMKEHFKINSNTSQNKILIKNAVLTMLTVVDFVP